MNQPDRILERLLVIKCQMGDRPALEELFRRHHERLRYYLRRILDNEDNVADVLQETWLTVIRQVGGLRSPEAFVVWLYRIARNKAFRSRSDDRPAEPLQAQDIPADDEIEFTPADAAKVHLGLQTLSPEHREALVLRFMEDLSYEDIAAVTNCTVGTVRSRLHYAKAALRTQLEKDYG